ncbi:LpxI family protein [Puniceibacterium sp. IMCC21224]|uniref:LpxI family protein n=1 Tax=Puniceibacterium sp. IMCC21224 TaxID=1618204 RepID=UPI00064D9F52|nr:UDP-2,3-diacylglucosamine diphosphatase LpxI [Puniceibacterium sp. IMCC21224]
MLALIAGRGALPAAVAGAQDVPPLICGFEGFAPDRLVADITFRIETLGSLFAELRARAVTQVCLCGSIRRPEIDLARVDNLTKPLLPVLYTALQAGDDGALRAVITLFEHAGLGVLAAHQAAPDLLMAAGVPSLTSLSIESEMDALVGVAALKQMGRADLGQASVIVAGQVVKSEDDRGTDAMLGDLPDADGAPRGILFKAPKPGQDRRADLPTIGPATVAAVARAGLAGIVIEAGGVIVLDRARVLQDVDAAGLFLWSRGVAG